jgi:hypothetical protein
MATTTVTGEIPQILEPYYLGQRGLIERGISQIFPGQQVGAGAYQQMMQPLIQAGLAGAGQIAPMSQFQTEAGRRIGAMQTPGEFGVAGQMGAAAGAGLQNLMGLQAQGVAAPELTQYQLGAPQMFGTEQAQQYMSPYMQGVVDIQQRNAIEAARQAQLGQNLASARQGTYGGARQALLQGTRESGLRQQLGDIQRTGLQSAYEQAQAQFERDRAAQMGVGQQNLAAALGVQQLGAGQSLEAQRANQAAALQAAQQRSQAAQGLGGLAQTMGGLGVQRLAGDLDIAKTVGAFGDLQRGIEQQQRDAQANYLQNMAQYGQTQVGQLSNLLRGIPMSDTRQITNTPPPSLASQLTGLGMTGLGIYNMMQGPSRGTTPVS